MQLKPENQKPERVWRIQMKKLIAALMTVLFLGSTTGLVLAQGTMAAPTSKTAKHPKKGKKGKKSVKKSTTAPSTSAPAAAPATK
jgi:hypothetical protein